MFQNFQNWKMPEFVHSLIFLHNVVIGSSHPSQKTEGNEAQASYDNNWIFFSGGIPLCILRGLHRYVNLVKLL